MKRTMFIVSAALVGVSLLFAAPAYATTTTNTVHVVSSPDDGNPPWARDTFDRKTTVTPTEIGFKVQFTDEGTFKTPAGLTGHLSGEGTFIVAGGSLKAESDLPPSEINRSSVDVKDDFTGTWWKRFISNGESAGIKDWKWVYTTECEKRIESESGGVEGEYPSKVCPPASTSPTATPSPVKGLPSFPASHSPKPSTSPSTSPGTVVIGNNGTGGNSLPVTGPGSALAIGAAVLLAGAGLIWVSRRRKAKFSA